MEEKMIIAYTPSSIVNIFNNALSNESTRKIIYAKGVYCKGKGMNYNGYYYDQLKEEGSDACITLIVPAMMRTTLNQNQVIECNAFLTKKVQPNGARIELQLNMIELLSQKESRYTDEQVQALKVVQRKVAAGYKDVDFFLKGKIIREEPISIIIIIGNTAIVDNDIKHQLEEAIGFFRFRFERINLASETAIISAIAAYDEEADVLVIARGGGENLGIFNKPAIAEVALGLNAHFLTAIGHEVDKTLLQQVADKGFITPTAFGQYLNSIYNDTVAELQNSKAKLVADITGQLKANYEHQITNLKEQATSTAAAHERRINELNQLNEEKIRMAKTGSGNTTVYWLLITAAIVIGIMIGKGCN